MIQVAIIIPRQCAVFSSINQIYQILDYTNLLLADNRKAPAFSVALVGETSGVTLYGGKCSIHPHYTLANHSFEADLVVIPALAGDIAAALQSNITFISWLIAQYEGGAQIAGFCTGTFMLADTQLVNKKDCLRNWYVPEDFRKQFSQVNMVAQSIVQQDDAIAAGNGAYTFFTRLLLSITDEQTASACATMFETEFNRECQSVFSIAKQKTVNKKQSIKTKAPFHIPYKQASLTDWLYFKPAFLHHSKAIDKGEMNTATNTGFHSSKKHSNVAALKGLFKNANLK